MTEKLQLFAPSTLLTLKLDEAGYTMYLSYWHFTTMFVYVFNHLRLSRKLCKKFCIAWMYAQFFNVWISSAAVRFICCLLFHAQCLKLVAVLHIFVRL